MSDTFQVALVTPNAVIAEIDTTELVATGELGEFGVLVGHTEYLTILRPGELRLHQERGVARYAVGRGFAEVGPNKVTILADTIEEADALDAPAIEQELEQDVERLKEHMPGDDEYPKLVDRIERNRARLAVARNSGT